MSWVSSLVVGASLAVAAAGCSSQAATASTVSDPTESVATTVSATVEPSTTAAVTDTTAAVTSSTVPGADPTFADTPEGECATLTPESFGFRNTTGHVADEYRIIGTSTQGRPIWSEHWGPRTGPQVLVLGQVHGDECTPAWMVQAIRAKPPVDFGIWLVPTVNPDGLAGHHRRTATDVDPNRDGFDLVTPEAQAVMAVTAAVQPVLTVHLHSPYKWVGAHNGPLAIRVATAMSEAAGWGLPRNAGRVRKGTQAFLWEGQELVLPGAQSVLVEFPAIADAEAPDAPDPSQRQVGTVEEVRIAALRMRDALYAAVVAPTVP